MEFGGYQREPAWRGARGSGLPCGEVCCILALRPSFVASSHCSVRCAGYSFPMSYSMYWLFVSKYRLRVPVASRATKLPMVTRASLDVHPATCRLLFGNTVACYSRSGVDSGAPLFFFERRLWEQHAGIKDLVGWRKQERSRGVLENMWPYWEIAKGMNFISLDEGRAHVPDLISTRALLCWLATRYTMAVNKEPHRACRANAWHALIGGMFDAADDCCRNLEQRPTLAVAGAVLQIQMDATISMRPLLDVWPSLCGDWALMANRPLAPVGALFVDQVPLRDLFMFLVCRCRWSSNTMPQDHPAQQLRVACSHVFSWLMEVHVHSAVIKTRELHRGNKEAHIKTVWGKTGARECHRQQCKILAKLEAMAYVAGSDQTIISSMGGPSGQAAQIRAIRNVVYMERVKSVMGGLKSVSISIDGSTHGGPEVQVGACTDVITGLTAYLRPQAKPASRGVTLQESAWVWQQRATANLGNICSPLSGHNAVCLFLLFQNGQAQTKNTDLRHAAPAINVEICCDLLKFVAIC